MRQAVRASLKAFQTLPGGSTARAGAVRAYLQSCAAAALCAGEKRKAHAG
jgi:hypothetical protein